jgi:hypothetical protein
MPLRCDFLVVTSSTLFARNRGLVRIFLPCVYRKVLILFMLFVFVCVYAYPSQILSVSIDCPFFIVPLVFSNAYLKSIWFSNILALSVHDKYYLRNASCTLNCFLHFITITGSISPVVNYKFPRVSAAQ